MLRKLQSYISAEVKTGGGQVVRVDYASDKEAAVLAALAEIQEITLPTTHRMTIGHGGYGRYSRYNIKQHDYAGGNSESGEGGYIEVLQIRRPPAGHHGVVVHEYTDHKGSSFSEWKTLKTAKAAFRKFWNTESTEKAYPKLRGFIRRVACGALIPWFYAVGDQEVIGDYVFPEDIQEDSVYRFGRKFVVTEYEGLPQIKTCMGCRFISGAQYEYPHKPYAYRIVFWDDGTAWNEMHRSSDVVRPLADDELWIDEAMLEFRKLLAGRQTKFDINFADGNKFVGRMIRAKNEGATAAGSYFAIIQVEGQKTREGWFGFEPTDQDPGVLAFLRRKFAKFPVQRIEIKDKRLSVAGKNGRGFFSSERCDRKKKRSTA